MNTTSEKTIEDPNASLHPIDLNRLRVSMGMRPYIQPEQREDSALV